MDFILVQRKAPNTQNKGVFLWFIVDLAGRACCQGVGISFNLYNVIGQNPKRLIKREKTGYSLYNVPVVCML